ncbi:MAG: ketol-acid reductoisomerase [Gemmatimonadetes bacterium]|nr:ketol-acid reductoisomerase [Gemmatimonadota bacterium]
MAKVYHDNDIDLKPILARTVGIVGYGSQGHAQAQNLRDTGVKVLVAEMKDTPNFRLAVEHGFKPATAAEVARQADILQVLIPDEIQRKVYEAEIAPNLKAGKALGFSHGFNIHFKQIVPPKDVDVIMVAPKGPGHTVRGEFVDGGGVPCLFAVYQDASGKARDAAMAYAKAIGGARAGVLETTFAEETETDLFGEQAVLCGGVTSLIKAGFETLVAAGYQPELAYFEVLHELNLIVKLLVQGGLSYMWYSVSNTAEYGGLTRGDVLIDASVRERMKKLLADIQSGAFAKEWVEECKAGGQKFKALEQKERAHLVEQVGRDLRRLMPFIDAKEV